MAKLQCPTADYILSVTGRAQLADIKSLELTNLELDYLDPAVFQQMTSLTVLDLSSNCLKEIPGNLGLPNLTKLDVAGNFLSSSTFVQQFTQLRELYLEGNNVEPSDKYIAASMCPSIVTIDKMKKESFSKMLQRQRDLMRSKVVEVWEEVYGKQFCQGIPDIQEETVALNFIQELKQRKLTATSNFQKYADYLVSVLARELIQQVQEGDYEPPAKKPKIPRSPIKALRKPEKEVRGNPASPKKSSRPKLDLDVGGSPRKPLSCQNSPLARTPPKESTPDHGSPATKAVVSVKPLRVTSPRSAARFTTIRHRRTRGNLAAGADYEPVHFIRCHSGSDDFEDDDPSDNETQIWASAFEPASKKSSQSSVVATCGGNTVCLIDCNTGRITKRMRQSGETFYTLAWTTLPMCSDGRKWMANVLAVSGIKGRVLLVHPDQLVCYTDFEVSKKPPKYVGSLLFHPTQPSKLFCGDFSGDINVWDIGLPTADKNQSTPQHLMTLTSNATNVLTMVWGDTTGHLVAGCEGGCFAWKINTQNMKKSQRKASTELVFSNKEKNIDGMCFIAKDLVACKLVKFGCIYVWRLSTTLRNPKVKVMVQPIAELEWQKTKEIYMNMEARDGLLVSGDDQGSLWLYNTEPILRKLTTHADDMVFRQSRILPWPECDITSKGDTEAKMTDLTESAQNLMVNDVAVSQDKEFIVAAMDNNMVGIWRREQDEDEDEEMDTD